MKLKLITIGLFVLVLPAALAAWAQSGNSQAANAQGESSIITLNIRGARERGAVRFDTITAATVMHLL